MAETTLTLVIAFAITAINVASAFFVSWALKQMQLLAGEVRDDLRAQLQRLTKTPGEQG